MKHFLSAVSIAAALSATIASAQAQTSYKAPRTADGKPDLQGVWTNVSLTTLLRSPQFKTDVVTAADAESIAKRRAAAMAKSLEPTDPNAPAPAKGGNVGGYNSFYGDAGERLAKVKGEYRTTWLIDSVNGQLPYSAEGRRIFDSKLAFTRTNFDGPEARPMAERCVVGFGSTAGPPMINVLYNNNYQIVQTANAVMIHVEMNHDARIVRVNAKHLPQSIRPWMGDSIGRWEGDTLVVETTNFNPGEQLRTNFDQSFYVSKDAVVTERFTRISPTEISYEFAVNDPAIYSKVWRAEMVMSAAEGNIYEYACHEGNYALPGILAGARKAESEGRIAEGGGGEIE
ncbi:MAG TPA: hypothetical protein VNA21_05900 [Steroidobacteraceae bacterium]|nr:hypothetical protein [Steroidobacteraceae bacterium]